MTTQVAFHFEYHRVGLAPAFSCLPLSLEGRQIFPAQVAGGKAIATAPPVSPGR